MIIYTEKGYGQHEEVRKAGHWLRQENGVWVSSNDAAVQLVLDGYTVAKEKSRVATAITALAKKKFDAAIADMSAGEMAGWSMLKSEADKWNISKLDSDCPSIAAEATNRGITVAALVAKVISNSNMFNGLRASIAGASGKHRDAVNALPDTFAAVAAYDYQVGW
jgi:CheY-like chemotaxis protein